MTWGKTPVKTFTDEEINITEQESELESSRNEIKKKDINIEIKEEVIEKE